MSGEPHQNLTGVWDGFYTYERRARAVVFGATLIETPSWLTGSTHEICSVGINKGSLLCATVDGRRSGNALAFLKSYDGSDPNYGAVHYFGEVSEDGLEIEGIWRISPTWHGRFLMVRSGGAATEERRQAFERAG